MKRYNISILGISEMRWTDSGIMTLNTGETVCYSGRKDGLHQEGVGILMDRKAKASLIGWEPVNERIIRARFFSKYAKTTVIQCYAPTEQATEEEKHLFYSKLQDELDKTPRHDILLLMGDFNAKVGSDNSGLEGCMGKEGMGERNDNGQRFADLCLENGLVIGGTIFQHKSIHKLTWISPDGRTRNQIDHIAINQKWRGSMMDVKTLRGADVGSDHSPVLCKIRLKLKGIQKRRTVQLFDSGKLRDAAIKGQFSLELTNRFRILEDTPADDINSLCNMVGEVFLDTSRQVLGYKKRMKKEWISENTWNRIEERTATKQRMLTGNQEERTEAAEIYKEKDQAVKRGARQDKRNYMDGLATEAQAAAEMGDTRTVYRITKSLTGGFTSKTTAVRDRNGKVLMKTEDQLHRWAEHFKETLNRPDPEVEATIEDTGFHVEMKRGRITQGEIKEAIRHTKGNRAPGEDRITADMLKADTATSAKALDKLFNKVWEEETVPETWKRGSL